MVDSKQIFTAPSDELSEIRRAIESGEGFSSIKHVALYFDVSIATIYNWKDGKNYCGEDGKDVEEITHWHVGGSKMQVETRLNFLLNKIPLGDGRDGRWIDAK